MWCRAHLETQEPLTSSVPLRSPNPAWSSGPCLRGTRGANTAMQRLNIAAGKRAGLSPLWGEGPTQAWARVTLSGRPNFAGSGGVGYCICGGLQTKAKYRVVAPWFFYS